MSNTPFEPSADMRRLAHTLRDMYEALVQAGFTESQALAILGYNISAMIATIVKEGDT